MSWLRVWIRLNGNSKKSSSLSSQSIWSQSTSSLCNLSLSSQSTTSMSQKISKQWGSPPFQTSHGSPNCATTTSTTPKPETTKQKWRFSMPLSRSIMSISEILQGWWLLLWQIDAIGLFARLFTWIMEAHLRAQQEQARQKLWKIWRRRLPVNAWSSTALMGLTTRLWGSSSRGWQHLVLGVASISSTESTCKCWAW